MTEFGKVTVLVYMYQRSFFTNTFLLFLYQVVLLCGGTTNMYVGM